MRVLHDSSVAILLLGCCALISACSGGAPGSSGAVFQPGDSQSVDGGTAPPTPVGPDQGDDAGAGERLLITGTASKGPLRDALVRLYRLGPDGHKLSDEALAVTRTDTQGNFALELTETAGDLLIETGGGSYVDESDPEPDPARKRVVELGIEDSFAAVLPAGETTAAITLYTNALLLKSRAETEGANFAAVFAHNRGLMQEAMGLDPVATLPADPADPAPDSSEAARLYALALGGAANALNNVAIGLGKVVASYAMIEALIRDFADCRLDGQDAGGAVLFDLDGSLAPLPVGLDLNTEIERFRNNNALLFESTPLLQIDTARCAESGRQPDIAHPVFTSVPGPFTFAAQDASGTPADDPAIAAHLGVAMAVDDRGGVVVIVDDAPLRFPLGLSIVRLTASDPAGNASAASVQITIADLTPPSITAPPDVESVASGTLTAVPLGLPVVTDNVSDTAAILITNNAPAEGFAVGTHEVSWSAMDAAGLGASAVQTITITSRPPVLLNPIGARSASRGIRFELDAAAHFSDPDGDRLIFSLQGLPPGSGLRIDHLSGLVSGTPSGTDAEFSPLELTVIVTDGVSELSETFSLEILVSNTPPRFTTSGDLYLMEDFQGTARLSVTPSPVPPEEAGQTVRYSLSPPIDFANVSIDALSGAVSVRSVPDASGSQLMVITADDGQPVDNTFTETFVLTVSERNDGPLLLAPLTPVTAIVGVPLSLDLAPGFADPDGDPLRFSADGLPESFALVPDTGFLSGTPTAADLADSPYLLQIRASDDELEVTAEMTLEVLKGQ